MIDGFIKVAAATPDLRVADCEYNVDHMKALIDEAARAGVHLIVFPELGITGYTCGDLFLQDTLLLGALDGLRELIRYSENFNMVIGAGLPLEIGGKLYNVAAVICKGKLLGLVPKKNIPNYSEFYEARHFCPGNDRPVSVQICGQQTWIGTRLLFKCENLPEFKLAFEICEDLWVPAPPSIGAALNGATVIANLSASDETTGKDSYRKSLVSGQSGRLVCGYVYADAGEGESTTDLVFAGHNMIGENGKILAQSHRFGSGLTMTELDVKKLTNERRRMNTFPGGDQSQVGTEYVGTSQENAYLEIPFQLEVTRTALTRFIDPLPFVPSDVNKRYSRCEEILNIQAMGLKKRLAHTGCSHAVVGISGGLDSTLALLVITRAFDLLGLDRKNIIAVTMPCFGTTDRTYRNACLLVETLGAALKEVDIRQAVRQHFKDIGHDENCHDVTYENAQARERTQVLMDIANQYDGLVIGTGDLSELALGWATYNGDHMSMYGVNASVPKTLVRHLVGFWADTTTDSLLSKTLKDILDTPVSPELIPPEAGKIVHKTEDLVGPYELHDFYLYYVMRFGFLPSKIYRLACHAFEGMYTPETVLKWLKKFYWRFFSQQFKRSCLPDGPKVGSVGVSPRGDLRMPSDACVTLWQKDLEQMLLSFN